MINEVEAAIHLFYSFRLTQGGTALSTTRFAHTHAAQGDFVQSRQLILTNRLSLYENISVIGLCLISWLIKTSI